MRGSACFAYAPIVYLTLRACAPTKGRPCSALTPLVAATSSPVLAVVLLYYKYVPLESPTAVCEWTRAVCSKLGMTGKVRLVCALSSLFYSLIWGDFVARPLTRLKENTAL